MSLVKIQGNASGTGEFTIAAPNSNTNYTLPTATGTIITTAGGAAISGTTGAFTTTVGVGGATPAASGAGITFPATASASSDANTLDDYEEGTWTPGIKFGSGTTGITYSSPVTGFYIKIGRLVYAFTRMVFTSKGSSSGVAVITGLPFTADAPATGAAGNVSFLGVGDFNFTNIGYINGQINDGTTEAPLYKVSTSGARTEMTNSDFQDSTRFSPTFIYQTS
jgi:hypothetical protein